MFKLRTLIYILSNSGVTHSVPTAFITHSVPTAFIMMNAWVRNGSRLGHDECSGYGMGHAWVMMNAVGTEWVTPELP